MDFIKTTKGYYSKFLGVSPEMMDISGVNFIESPERDKIQAGYSKKFDVYAYITLNNTIISYSSKISDKIIKLKDKIKPGVIVDEVLNILEQDFNIKANHNLIFYYDKFPDIIDNVKAVQLKEDDYDKFLEFYKSKDEKVNTDGWLHKYFNNICRKGYAFGIFDNEKFVSVTDAPDMPYMQDKVQEIGIETLTEYRHKGYAASAVLSCIKYMIKKGICPEWSCSANNSASSGLALKSGFKKLADIITISI